MLRASTLTCCYIDTIVGRQGSIRKQCHSQEAVEFLCKTMWQHFLPTLCPPKLVLNILPEKKPKPLGVPHPSVAPCLQRNWQGKHAMNAKELKNSHCLLRWGSMECTKSPKYCNGIAAAGGAVEQRRYIHAYNFLIEQTE